MTKDLMEAAKTYADEGDMDTNRDWFVAGAEWQKEHLINKACEWLYQQQLSLPNQEKFINDFKKAMEE